MKYQCKRCERVIDLPEKQTNGVVRKRHACESCNDITTFKKLDHDVSELTDAQREFFRNIHQEIRINRHNQSQKTIHIDAGTDTLCNHGLETRVVSVEKYPLGYLDWCTHCLQRSKNRQQKFECATEEESVQKAIQYANENVDGEITRGEYAAMDIVPSVWTIRKVYDTWANAKEESL